MLALALVLSVLGVALVMLGTGRLYAPSLQGRRALLLPAGALVYIAIPPARDFATSGLESGLALAYLGLLWWMMVCWSQALRAHPAQPGQRSVRADEPQHNITGPVFEPGAKRVGNNRVAVPSHLFTLVYDPSTGRSWAHWQQNEPSAKVDRPISYEELVRRTGAEWLPGRNPGAGRR